MIRTRANAPSPCGIHHTYTWPCVHCARAAVHNAAALADVVPTYRSGQPLKRTEATVSEIRQRVASGEPITKVANDFGTTPSTIGKIVRGTLNAGNMPATHNQRTGMYRRGHAEENAIRKSVPYPKQAAG